MVSQESRKKKHQQLLLEVETPFQARKSTFYRNATTVDATERQERLNMLAHIQNDIGATHLSSTNYHVDKSIREASLAGHDQWQEEEETLVFTSSNHLKVYLGTPKHPLEMSEALRRIRELGETTALTARIVLGIWNLRRANNQLAKNGSVAMRLEEVLEWRGIKKHSYLAYPSTQIRHTDGYRVEHREQVLKDLDLLASCCVRGKVRVTFKSKPTNFSINGPYLRYAVVTHETLWAEEAIAGIFVAPGDWINTYTDQDNYFFAEIDRRIFQLHPQNEQHEIRLALFLTEKWREQGKKGSNYAGKITMADLLAASIIRIDKANLTNRFVPRIERALDNLSEKKIIGRPALCLNPPDTTKARWGKDWLASEWIIVPPPEIQSYYETTLRPIAIPKRVPPRRKGTVDRIGL
jgi:hypothetical protein